MKTEKTYSHKDTKTQRKTAKKGFTLVEILTAVTIIAIMVSVLLPAFNMVRKMGRDVQQKAQIASIDVGINLYKNDFGDYPQSHGKGTSPQQYYYCGSQTLTEAMFGQDLLGVDPNTEFDPNPSPNPYTTATLNMRKGPYLNRDNIAVFKPQELYPKFSANGLVGDKYVICDVYPQFSKNIPGYAKKVKIGNPVLYFKANISQTEINPRSTNTSIYDFVDNQFLIEQGRNKDGKQHEDIWNPNTGEPDKFYEFIKDPLVSKPITTIDRPVRPDSFLLISAGNDGLYGTTDDICNFEPNIE